VIVLGILENSVGWEMMLFQFFDSADWGSEKHRSGNP